MKKTVLTFGLIAGAILSAMMVLTMRFQNSIGFDRAEIVGYTSMVAGFLLVWFGIRSYRDNERGGRIGFGRALAVGALIVAVASACYTATWEVLYYNFMPEFGAKYGEYTIQKARAAGKPQAEIDRQIAETKHFTEMYKNPVYNSALTFLEPLPVGLLIAVVSAGMLSRRRRDGVPSVAPAGPVPT